MENNTDLIDLMNLICEINIIDAFSEKKVIIRFDNFVNTISVRYCSNGVLKTLNEDEETFDIKTSNKSSIKQNIILLKDLKDRLKNMIQTENEKN